MDLMTMSTAKLQVAAQEAGLPTWGTKNQLIQRLQAHATSALRNTPPETPQKDPTAPAVTDSAHDGFRDAETKAVYEKLSRLYGHQLRVTYDHTQHVFQFDGGPQGRTTTTASQPASAILKVASQHISIAQNALAYSGALGSIGGE